MSVSLQLCVWVHILPPLANAGILLPSPQNHAISNLDAVCVLVLVCRDVCVLVWRVCRDVCVLTLVGSAWRDAWADESQAWNVAAAGGEP